MPPEKICGSGITNYTFIQSVTDLLCHLNIWRHWMFDTDKYVLVVCVTVQWSVQDWSDTILTNSVQSSVQLSTITSFSDPEYQYLDQDKNANTSLKSTLLF